MKKTILLAFVPLLFLACQENKKIELEAKDSAEHVDTHANHEQHEHNAVEGLYLNQGEAWIINEEMKPFVLNAKDILGTYNNADYKQIAEALKEQNQLLINSCTMQGESHDVLHEWLVPHLDLTKELANAENAEAAKAIVDQLNQSFTTFAKYFK